MTLTPDTFKTDDGRTFHVFYDTDAEDPRTWDEDVSIIVLRSGTALDATPQWGGSELEEAARAIWEYCKDSYVLSTAINAVPGWIAHTTVIHGDVQSEWAEVIALKEDADTLVTRSRLHNAINTFRQWAYGDVYVVSEVDGESIGGIYADGMEDAVCAFIDGN